MSNQTKQPESPRDAKLYTSGDLTEATGLSYRVVNDWEVRAEIFSSEREGEAGWRKFSENDLYALRICADVKARIPLGLEEIGGIYRWLKSADLRGKPVSPKEIDSGVELIVRQLEDDPERASLVKDAHARRIIEQQLRALLQRPKSPIEMAVEMAEAGVPIYLFTNLEKHMILMESSLEQLVKTRLAASPTIIFQLNGSLSAVRGGLKLKSLPSTHYAVEELVEVLAQSSLSKKEEQVLRMIRERAYERVTVELKAGKIVQCFVEEELAGDFLEKTEKQISDAIKSGAYQTLTLRVHKGKIVRLERKTPIKFGKAAGTT